MIRWTVQLTLVGVMVWSVMPVRAGVEPVETASNLSTTPMGIATNASPGALGESPGDAAGPAVARGSEPAALLLLGMGFIGIAALTRRRTAAAR